MALWIPITIAAAFLQNLRSAAQAHLKGVVGQDGATFSRFVYGLPFALAYFAALTAFVEAAPSPTRAWAAFTVLAALSQIAATYALLASFDGAGFGVGTAYSKTEPILAVLLGAAILSELPSLAGGFAIIIGVVGVLALTVENGWRLFASTQGVALGLLAAAFFGMSGVGYRAASLSLDDGGFLIRAAMTLAAALLFQTLAQGAWIAWRKPGELTRVAISWRWGLAAGAAGAAASAGWFTAMTLEPAAHVKAVGQIELVFTFLASAFWFRERQKPQHYLGAALIAAGAIGVVLFG